MTLRATTGFRRCAAVLLAVLSAAAGAAQQHPSADVPYVPTPQVVVDEMLRMAKVGPADYVIDLGSGDGRIVITAAKKLGARGLGVDIDGALVSDARREARRQGVAGLVEFHERNLFVTDISRATVLTLYLFPSVIMQLRPRLFADLKPGTRVVSHEFGMENWLPDARATVPVPNKPYGPPSSEVYLWVVPANAAGVWRWRLEGGATADYELVLRQAFQMLEGSPSAGGRALRLVNGRIRGEAIAFTLVTTADGRAVREEYSGRIEGDSISGQVRFGNDEREWRATRVRRGNIEFDAAVPAAR